MPIAEKLLRSAVALGPVAGSASEREIAQVIAAAAVKGYDVINFASAGETDATVRAPIVLCCTKQDNICGAVFSFGV